MSDLVENKVNELLNEEKWTRATLNSYTINHLNELDAVIESAENPDEILQIKEICDEHLIHTRNSVIALYMSGIISISRQVIDDGNLIKIINIFTDNHKWNIVEYLCTKILSYGENIFALRTLSDCYEHENEKDKKYEIWKRLIKVDYEEADIVRSLAENEEAESNIELAVEYYKRSIHRYINKKLFSSVKDVWHKLVTLIPDETDFFFHIEKKVSKINSPERALQLLEDLYDIHKSKEQWKKCINILKRILFYDPKNVTARREITESFRQLYKDHGNLEEYIRLSNLNQSWRNVHDAIGDFEKHISVDAGTFVSHKTWGIGLIREIQGDNIIIDFTRKRGHIMSLKMAVSALTSLTKDHIWVLRSIWPKDKLHQAVKGNVSWALKMVIRSFDNAANMKQIKAELVPSILSPGEWSTWSTEARKQLKTDPAFGNVPEKIDFFVVRDTPMSFDEKTYNRFKAERGYFGKLKIFREFLDNSDPESEYFGEMFNYFTGFLKEDSNAHEYAVSSYLIITHIVSIYPFLNPGIPFEFKDLLDNMEDIESIFSIIEDTELRLQFLKVTKGSFQEWPEIFVKLFPYHLTKYIIEILKDENHIELLKDLYNRALYHYKDKREAFIWLARNTEKNLWLENYGIPFEKVLIGMIHLLDISFREINNKREVSFNRKINKQILNFLFKENHLPDHLDSADQDSVNRIFSLVNDVKDLDPSVKLELKSTVLGRFPKFRFHGQEEKEMVSRGLIVTRKSFEEKQARLQHIIETEIPLNSKEIGAAIDLGDLKENAEYKAGKEKQEFLNSAVGKLKDELEKASIFNSIEVDPGTISFGTEVKLLNMKTEKEETFTFFGPWESDPSNFCISYLSPFGNKLWKHKVGDEVAFEINERDYKYRVESITATDF
jgi:transcription elongation factor GreA